MISRTKRTLVVKAAMVGGAGVDGLSTKIVEADVLIFYTQRVEQVEDGLGHHRRTAEVVLDVLGGVMLLEVGVASHASTRNEYARVAERERPLSNHVTSLQ